MVLGDILHWIFQTPTKCTIFIAGSNKLCDEHNIIKSVIYGLSQECDYPGKGLMVETKNFSLGHEQSEYDKIITDPNT